MERISLERLGEIESLPDYSKTAEALMHRHDNNPLVLREELDEMLGEHGNVEAFLMSLTAKHEYLVHGSQSLVDEVEPRKPKDGKGTTENELFAVYATDIPALAIHIGLLSKAKIDAIKAQGRIVRSASSITLIPDAELKVPLFYSGVPVEEVLDNGYIYVFKGESFAPTDDDPAKNHQFVSHTAVKPVLILSIKPSDFNHEVTERMPN